MRNRTRRRNTGIGTDLGLGEDQGQDHAPGDGQLRDPVGITTEARIGSQEAVPGPGKLMIQETTGTPALTNGKITAERILPNWIVVLPILNIIRKFFNRFLCLSWSNFWK